MLVLAAPLVASATDIPDQWLTVAEKNAFEITASHAQTLEFLERAAAESEMIQVTTFGNSGLGRQLPLVIVSKDGHFTPEAAHAAGKAVVLIQSCIHPGEVDGKTASMMILRDIVLGRHSDLLDAGVILFAPIYNADGHEDISPTNRANQHGPVGGMGFRTTVTGLDLNRDHLKLDSMEARALASLVNRWQPHLHVDNHVTNGSHHHWILTWSRAEEPQLAPSLDLWLNDHLPPVFEKLEKAGIPNGPYVSLIDRNDPSQGIDSSVAGPRYSTGYFTLRNRISLLIEMYAYAPYEARVRANKGLLEELLLEIAREPQGLVNAVDQAGTRTTELGLPDAKPSDIVLRWRTMTGKDTVAFPVCKWTTEDSMVTGSPMIHFNCSEADPLLDVPWRHRPEVELSIKRPRGYILMPGWTEAQRRLKNHGLILEVLGNSVTLEVETIRLTRPATADSPYQGRVVIEDFQTSRQTERRTIPEGALWIPADQPDFEIAVQLLEPEAPDSLVRWGLLNSVFERKEYIGLDTLEALARDLVSDPEIQQAWEQALENEDFADNGGARYIWWYRQTAFWDQTIGLMPVYRVMEPVDLPTNILSHTSQHSSKRDERSTLNVQLPTLKEEPQEPLSLSEERTILGSAHRTEHSRFDVGRWALDVFAAARYLEHTADEFSKAPG